MKTTKRLSLLLSGCVLVCSGCTGTSDPSLPETISELSPVVESDAQDDVSAVTEPVGRVVGLLSDGNGGSVAVAYDTDTWEYEVIQELPDVTPDNYAALSADDTKLAYTTWSDSYTVRYVEVLDRQTGETRAFFDDMGYRNEIIKISWMPDNVSLLYIHNNTNNFLQTIEYIQTDTGEITRVDTGEAWNVRTVEYADVDVEPFVSPGSGKEWPVKWIAEPNEYNECWFYYMDEEDLKEIYEAYGGVREFDFSTIIDRMCVTYSAPRCSVDGKMIVYSAFLDRDSAPGEHTPLWVAAGIWTYDVETQEKQMVYSQADEACIGRVDWVSEDEICFVTYYEWIGSCDDICYYNLSTGEMKILFPHTEEYYNNMTLLPIGGRTISFTSCLPDALYSTSDTYVIDVDTGAWEKLDVQYEGEPVILENFIYQ